MPQFKSLQLLSLCAFLLAAPAAAVVQRLNDAGIRSRSRVG